MQKHLSSVFLFLIFLYFIVIGHTSKSAIAGAKAVSLSITDLQLRVSDRSEPPSVEGYRRIGYWDVEGKKSRDTLGNLGKGMMGLYTKSETTQDVSPCITDLQLRVSNKSEPPSVEGYRRIGYWDVQGKQSRDTLGNLGHWMMGLYAKSEATQDVSCCLEDIQLRVSNSAKPQAEPAGYELMGYWDVEGKKSRDTIGNLGHWMMGLYIKRSITPTHELGKKDIEQMIVQFGPHLYLRADEKYLMDDPEYVLDNGVSLESGIVEMRGKKPEHNYDSFQLNRVTSLITSNKTLIDDVLKVQKLIKDSPDSEKYEYWLRIDDSMKPGNLDRAKAQVRILPAEDAMHTEIQFWFFYPFNGPGRVEVCASSKMCDDNWLKQVGRHYGDWEHVSLLIRNPIKCIPKSSKLISVYMSSHAGGKRFDRSADGIFRSMPDRRNVLKFHDTHPVVYSAVSSHAHYSSAGNHPYKRVYSKEWGWPIKLGTASADLFDRTARDRLFRTYSHYRIISSDLPNFEVSEPEWAEFKGRWGQYEKLFDNIKFSGAKIEVWRYKEVGNGPVGPKQHKESWNKGDFHP
jgi:hypothetical protein